MVVLATKVFYSSSKSSNYSFLGRLAVFDQGTLGFATQWKLDRGVKGEGGGGGHDEQEHGHCGHGSWKATKSYITSLRRRVVDKEEEVFL